jgi:hypothetical protein
LLSSVDGEGIFEAAQGFPKVTYSAMFMFFHVVYCVCVNVFIFLARRSLERGRGLVREEIGSGKALDWDSKHPEMLLKVCFFTILLSSWLFYPCLKM